MTTVRPDSHTDSSAGHAVPVAQPLPRLKGLKGGRRIRHHPSEPQRGHAWTAVTVVCNGCDMLAESVASVLAQQRSDVAHVVDGGSKDRTVDFLESCCGKIEYWISERDRGISHAMNKTVQFATQGNYSLFLGSSDKILRLSDPATIAEARDSGTQLLFGNVLIGDWLFRFWLRAKLQYRNTLHHQGLFIHKEGPQELWSDESLKVLSDWDLNLKPFLNGVSAQRLNYTITYVEPDGASAKLHLSEIARMIRKRCGPLQALVAIIYHGGLHLVRQTCKHSSQPSHIARCGMCSLLC